MCCADSVGTGFSYTICSGYFWWPKASLFKFMSLFPFPPPSSFNFIFFFHWQHNAAQHLQVGKQHQQSCLSAGYFFFFFKYCQRRHIQLLTSWALKQPISAPHPWSYMLCQYLPLLKALHSFSLAWLFFPCGRTYTDEEQLRYIIE